MVKEKPNSIRIYDDEGFRRRAACICVRSESETESLSASFGQCPGAPSDVIQLNNFAQGLWLYQKKDKAEDGDYITLLLKVLLVTSSRRPDNWIVPGGGVEPEEEPSVTATREVLEEAGVIGKLGRSLGVFENSEHKDRTEVYVMIVTEELDEWEDSRTIGRKRQWFTIDEALEKLALHKPVQRHYLQQLLRSKLT